MESAREAQKSKGQKPNPNAALTVIKPDGSKEHTIAAKWKEEQAKSQRPVVSEPNFCLSQPWREIRYKALWQAGGKCSLCGRGRKEGVVLHVDHIPPRSKYPDKELDANNLQVLCEDCNLGKSNKDRTDWR